MRDIIMRRRGIWRVLLLCTAALPQLADGAAPAATPDFGGFWVRPEAGNERIYYPPDQGPGPIVNTDSSSEFMIGDHTAPILRPEAAAAVKAHADKGRAGVVEYPPWSLCWPTGVPLALNMAEPVQFLQTPDQVTIIYQRGMQHRRIYLNAAHPANLKPSWYGHSIGHYENGDTLVVDTVAQDTRSVVDRFGTPKSEMFHIVERYRLTPDKSRLEIGFAIDDPKSFTTAWSAKVAYVRTSSRRGYDPAKPGMEEIVCPENNRDAAGGDFPIPRDETPDF
jgi:hypothetical protein